jgi:hypothetical protein
MENKNKISFALRQIQTEQFATFEENICQKDSVQLEFGVAFGVADNHMLKCTTLFNFHCDEKVFIKLETACAFQIHEDSWHLMENKEKKAFIIPEYFARHLAALTLGTARGILHEKTIGTEFNHYLLPTINLNDIIKEDKIIEMKD